MVRESASGDLGTATAAELLVEGASKSYGRSETNRRGASERRIALGAIDLRVQRGRFVSVIGPSGCGKSTLLRMIAGLEHPDAGAVSIFGSTPAEASEAKRIAFMPQVPALLPWLSVLENVKIVDRVNRRANRRMDALRRGPESTGGPAGHGAGVGVALAPEADPVALLTELGLGDSLKLLPGELSGGMQQRVAIARAFATQGDVLLMDEPFSALDEFTRESTQDQLLKLWEEWRTTVVFVTHSVTEAVVLSDEVVVMAGGRGEPGRIAAIVPIELPRPRRRGLLEAAAVHEYEDRIRAELQAARRSPGSPGGPRESRAPLPPNLTPGQSSDDSAVPPPGSAE
ncbi:ABC transporter ATP-binding protein [Subtercola sp. PAMC28395]|uniref:ABC transporter ATP-binding protein n=1 Tax=Subtercola sp. PAMC28395 TaxID=2846775 RepID=UPI001C0CDF4F|nr:ABC transporter ATP-binding protein [Subtercola sp. PAMC28395]QWT24770.1 ABC transporter ATP-binding protein [Subtercola sp. PAMC28395]